MAAEPETGSFRSLTAYGFAKLLARATFRDFTDLDWQGFSGCESDNPKIAEVDNYVIILDNTPDGEVVFNVIHEDDEFGGQLFDLTERY